MLCFHDTNQKILKKGILFLNVVKLKTDKRKKLLWYNRLLIAESGIVNSFFCKQIAAKR